MFDVKSAARDGASWITHTPQIWSTAFLAVAIVASFLFMTERFASIALDAQERLVNVRVGALQDSFVPLAQILATDTPALAMRIRELQAQNPTIRDMYVVQKQSAHWVILASSNPAAASTTDVGNEFLYGLTLEDRLHSITIQEPGASERIYKTARFVDDTPDGPLIAVTRQTLSEADRQVSQSLLEGIGILVVVLVLLLVLFFRHSRIIDYASLYKRLKEVDTLKDDFLSMASHELRTPLTIIRGYAENLREQTLVEEERIKYAERIDVSARELDTLITDMLDVSRIEQGRMRYDLKTLSPKDVIETVCTGLMERAQAKGLTLTTELAPDLSISADTDRLRQVALNLIGNAVKYTEKGSVVVRLVADGARVVFEIQDTGLGMTSEEQGKLFAKFYRSESSDVRAQAGTGLGLWITKQMIEAMQGIITVESIKGVGSKFRVSFPRA